MLDFHASRFHILGSHIAALLLLGTATTACSRRLVVVVVVVVVGLQDLLAQLLLSFVDVRVQFVSVLSDRELLVVIDWNVNLPSADWLILRVVELGHIWVAQSLFCGQSSIWIELQQVAEKIQSVV